MNAENRTAQSLTTLLRGDGASTSILGDQAACRDLSLALSPHAAHALDNSPQSHTQIQVPGGQQFCLQGLPLIHHVGKPSLSLIKTPCFGLNGSIQGAQEPPDTLSGP